MNLVPFHLVIKMVIVLMSADRCAELVVYKGSLEMNRDYEQTFSADNTNIVG